MSLLGSLLNDDLDKASPAQQNDILDASLSKMILALAALKRAGPLYADDLEPFWFFAAPSFRDDRDAYERSVQREHNRLPTHICKERDVAFGLDLIEQAIGLLRQGVEGDASDLEMALEEFQRKCGLQKGRGFGDWTAVDHE